jgi:hypothetical protein
MFGGRAGTLTRDDCARFGLAEIHSVLFFPNSGGAPTKKIPEWEDDRRKEGKWKDVRYLDGVSLVQ